MLKQCPLFASHSTRVGRTLMIVTEKVEDAMDHQPGYFPTEAVTAFPGLPAGRRG